MSYSTPPFTITSKIIHCIADISETIGKISALYTEYELQQYKELNKTKYIKNSLAINSTDLTESQISNIMQKNTTTSPLKDAQQTNNIIDIYNQLKHKNIKHCSDLLTTHKTLMNTLSNEAGSYRTHSIKMTPQASRIPQMMADLFEWLNTTEQHPLITSCVFHYELQFIHPFTNGNCHIGCIWQMLILNQWNSIFSTLSIEGIVVQTMNKYNETICSSTASGDSSVFIEYMLENILVATKILKSSLLSTNKEAPPQGNPQVKLYQNISSQTPQVNALIKVLQQADNALNRKDLQNKLNLKDRKHFRACYLKPAIDDGLIEMTIPDKPNSKMQKYRLTITN